MKTMTFNSVLRTVLIMAVVSSFINTYAYTFQTGSSLNLRSVLTNGKLQDYNASSSFREQDDPDIQDPEISIEEYDEYVIIYAWMPYEWVENYNASIRMEVLVDGVLMDQDEIVCDDECQCSYTIYRDGADHLVSVHLYLFTTEETIKEVSAEYNVSAQPQTEAPTILTDRIYSSGFEVFAIGKGDIYLFIDDQPVCNPYDYLRDCEDHQHLAYAFAQEPGKRMSDTTYLGFEVPSLPHLPKPKVIIEEYSEYLVIDAMRGDPYPNEDGGYYPNNGYVELYIDDQWVDKPYTLFRDNQKHIISITAEVTAGEEWFSCPNETSVTYFVAPLNSRHFIIDRIHYLTINDNEVVVTAGEDAYDGIVNIPEIVTYEGVTYTVTCVDGDAFTNTSLESLTLPVTIGNIEEGAFTGCHIHSLIITGDGIWTAGAVSCTVDHLYVMGSVTGIQGLQVNPTMVYSYPTVPPTCDEQSFTGYDGELHVPASALAAYFTAPYWCNFINIAGDAIEPTGLTINLDSLEIPIGNQFVLSIIPVPANATPQDYIWTSTNESIATVDDGVINAIKAGECDIKVNLLDKNAVCHVTVIKIPPSEITISQDFAKLEIDSQLKLSANVLPENTTYSVYWTTSKSTVATVDNQGVVTAVGPGECSISAHCYDRQAMCHIIVVDHFIFITLDEHEVRLMPNHMFTLTPTVSPANTSLVVTSSDPTVAAARMANGKIQVVGVKEGNTVVTVNSTDGYAEVDSCLVIVYTLRGDVNCDGFVNINDVTALINYLLSGNTEGIDLINADTNNDGKTNIGDVTRLINHLLSDDELDPKEDPIEGAETFTVNGVSFTMVAVEGGTFTMGATPEQGEDALDAEKPAHQVTLSDYAIGQTEVTQALWVAVMGTNPSRFKDRPENPVEGVTWTDCQTFITQLNQMTGRNFRLLTEAEWEYAARGGNKSQGYKYAGSNDIDEVAWYDQNSTSTQPVGTKKANELGIYDMSGNVWEWCQDYYGDYSAEPQTNPTGPETGTDRIRRGVGWNGGQINARVSHRSSRAETYKYNSLGLRLAL